MEKVYVFGHKKPDTDSVAAAITASYYINETHKNMKASPRVLGHLNNETKFILNYFNVPSPKYLNDVRLQIRDVNFKKNFYLEKHHSIMECYNYMLNNNTSGVPIVDNERNLLGIVTLKEIAKELITGNFDYLHTSYDNLLKTLNAREVLRFDDEIDANIMAASFRSTTFLNNIELDNNTALIVGDRHSIIEYAIASKVKLIIVVGNGEIKLSHLKVAKENKVNIIKTPLSTFEVTKLINMSNYIDTLNIGPSAVTFNLFDYLSDFNEIANRVRHTNYPIVDKDNKCLGMLRINDIVDKKRKKVILVDHNEESQSVDGLDEAEIIEVIDHHRLGTIATTLPINFRNMAVGSTNTILYLMYKERNIEIPRHIAGLMLSAIISDTLLLKSPTTTKIDREAVLALANYLEIDYKEYGIKMFEAGSELKDKTKEEIIYHDFKLFHVEDKQIGVGQIFTTSFNYVEKDILEYQKLLDNISLNNNYIVVALFITDIIKNGSYIIYNSKAEKIMSEAFDLDNIKQGIFLKDIVSRKKQMIPQMIEVLENR